jgi:hypothetical protein
MLLAVVMAVTERGRICSSRFPRQLAMRAAPRDGQYRGDGLRLRRGMRIVRAGAAILDGYY